MPFWEDYDDLIKSDIADIKKSYLKGLKFHYVTEMHEVINLALTKQ